MGGPGLVLSGLLVPAIDAGLKITAINYEYMT